MDSVESKARQVEAAERLTRRPIGNVLVATDFSPRAARAVARAARLPITPGSSITILHVLARGAPPDAERDARRVLAQQAASARRAAREAGLTDVEVFTTVARGKPFVEIIDGARHATAHLIVVGRHGQRPFRDLLVGSTAERVVRKGATPTLVVSAGGSGPYRRPRVAVDGSNTSRRAFELALQIAGSPTGGFDVVHAYGVPYESGERPSGIRETNLSAYGFETGKAARAMVEDLLVSLKVERGKFTALLRRGDPRRVILQVATQRRSDLLALGTHGQSDLAHVLIGSVAEAVVRAAPCDVLVARPAGFRFSLP
jgi:nucleotide-binding universal stress UspA family protein